MPLKKLFLRCVGKDKKKKLIRAPVMPRFCECPCDICQSGRCNRVPSDRFPLINLRQAMTDTVYLDYTEIRSSESSVSDESDGSDQGIISVPRCT